MSQEIIKKTEITGILSSQLLNTAARGPTYFLIDKIQIRKDNGKPNPVILHKHWEVEMGRYTLWGCTSYYQVAFVTFFCNMLLTIETISGIRDNKRRKEAT